MASLIVGLLILFGPRPPGRRFVWELFNILVVPFRLRGTTATTRSAAVPGIGRFRYTHFATGPVFAAPALSLSRIRSGFYYPLGSGPLQTQGLTAIPLRNLAIENHP